MSFTSALGKSLIGKVVIVYVPNGRHYKGVLKAFTDDYVNINEVIFNVNQVVSISEVVRKSVR